MTLPQLRHEIRNHLNSIKLTSALLQRRHADELTQEGLHDVDRAVDGINELITRFLGGADFVELGMRQADQPVMSGRQ